MNLQGVLNEALGGSTISHMSQVLGADENSTGSAVQAALPAIIGALARNSSSESGAAALAGALERDHDGSVLGDVIGFLSNYGQGSGAGILGHVFGARQQAVEAEVGKSSGLDAATVGKLLVMLAPIVMGALGKTQRQQSMDPSSLAGFLENERQQVEASDSPIAGMLSQLLDSNRDGSVVDDIARLAGGLFGGKS